MKSRMSIILATTVIAAVTGPWPAHARRATDGAAPRYMTLPVSEPVPSELRQFVTSPTLSSSVADTFHLAWYNFDNGGSPSAQGWTPADLTAQIDTFFHVADTSELNGGHFGRLVPLEGNQSLWCGVDTTSAPFCAYANPGYGNDWYQMFTSKFVHCDSVRLYYKVSFDSEPGYDKTFVEYWDAGFSDWTPLPVLGGNGFYDGFGMLTECFSFGVPDDSTRIRFRFVSDDAFSSEDGLFVFDGAVIVDSITVLCYENGSLVDSIYEDFEGEPPGAHVTDDGYWRATVKNPFGSFADLYPGTAVLQQDPCVFDKSFLWGWFDDPANSNYGCAGFPEQGAIPKGNLDCQYLDEEIWSPPIPYAGSGTDVELRFRVYRDMPLDNLVFYNWRVRSWIGGCPGPWRGDAYYFFGGQKDWHRASFPIGSYIDEGADSIQVAVGAFDGCPIWCLYYCSATPEGSCRGPAPYIDEVHVVRIDVHGPRYSVRHVDLFQDNFSTDGTITGTARADAANDIATPVNPVIIPGDSVGLTVSDPDVGLAGDPLSGTGPAVYLYAANTVDTGGRTLSGADMEAPETRSGIGKRFPLVDSLMHDGMWWFCFRADSVFDGNGNAVDDRFCVDLNDNYLRPGDEIGYIFCAQNTGGTRTYWSRRVGGQGVDFVTDDLWEALSSPLEFAILPSAPVRIGPTANFLYVDDADDRGGEAPVQLYVDWVFAWMGIDHLFDRYDVLGPSSTVNNSLASRVTSIQNQITDVYKNIIWCSGDLSTGLIGDGGPVNGGNGPDESNDFGLLLEFLDQSTMTPGLFITGDSNAEEWAIRTGPDAISLRSTYMNFGLQNGDHVAAGEPVSPNLVGVGDCFIHAGVADSLIAYGGCPAINDFDLLQANSPAVVELENPTSGNGYLLSQTTANMAGDTARVVLSGFSVHYAHQAEPGFPFARMELIRDVLWWFENSLPQPTAVDESPRIASNFLANNYPNPFNPTTTIKYGVAERSHVTLRIYNAAGQLVRTLVDEMKDPKADGHVARWDGTTTRGEPVASGVYFYKLVTNEFTKTKKMVLLK